MPRRPLRIPLPVVGACLAVGLAVILGGAAPGAALGAPPARVVSNVPAAGHVVALTFDDAWDPAATRRLFEILAAEDVPATFFPVAVGVEGDPALWREIVAAGDVVGSHTIDHPDLTALSDERLVAEIGGARRAIEAALGERMAPLLRPPFGRLDDRVRHVAAAAGYGTLVLWDVASSDWAEPDPSVVAARSLAGHDGSIVLLHAGPASTIAALPAIIAGYRARGFALVTVPALLAAAG
ncbi:MAG TPA: polysaccharide deacetylase family protein [Candidatus Limnocylindrales bacterium]